MGVYHLPKNLDGYTAAPLGERPLVLLIDDNAEFMLGMRGFLQLSGYRVVLAANGTQGLLLAEQTRPDLIVCDVMMPAPNGLEVRKRLAQLKGLAEIPFIFLTARTAPADKVAGLAMGADDYIVKPFDPPELLARLRVILHRSERARPTETEIETERPAAAEAGLPPELETPASTRLQAKATYPHTGPLQR